jgi:hypothetical protein
MFTPPQWNGSIAYFGAFDLGTEAANHVFMTSGAQLYAAHVRFHRRLRESRRARVNGTACRPLPKSALGTTVNLDWLVAATAQILSGMPADASSQAQVQVDFDVSPNVGGSERRE